MIDVAITWEEGEKQEGLFFAIANHMKKCYLKWNKDTVEDSVIFNHLYELSDGKIDLRNVEDHLVQPDRPNHSYSNSGHSQQNRTNNNNNQHRTNNNQNRTNASNNNRNNNNRNQNIRNNRG